MHIDESNYIPVESKKDGKFEMWYLDISNLGLHELTLLKKEIIGGNQISVRAIDRIIYEKSGYRRHIEPPTTRELKHEQKREYQKKKKLTRKHHKHY